MCELLNYYYPQIEDTKIMSYKILNVDLMQICVIYNSENEYDDGRFSTINTQNINTYVEYNPKERLYSILDLFNSNYYHIVNYSLIKWYMILFAKEYGFNYKASPSAINSDKSIRKKYIKNPSHSVLLSFNTPFEDTDIKPFGGIYHYKSTTLYICNIDNNVKIFNFTADDMDANYNNHRVYVYKNAHEQDIIDIINYVGDTLLYCIYEIKLHNVDKINERYAIALHHNIIDEIFSDMVIDKMKVMNRFISGTNLITLCSNILNNKILYMLFVLVVVIIIIIIIKYKHR